MYNQVALAYYYLHRELMETVREEGKRLMEAQPSETAVGNMVRRGKLPLLKFP